VTRQEWQQKLNDLFPQGVQVTVLGDNPIRFLAVKLTVVAVDNEVPVVCVYPVNVDKEVMFRIAELLEIDQDVYIVKQPGDLPRIQMDTRFNPQAAQELKLLRAAR
jgi:hypothetical protein